MGRSDGTIECLFENKMFTVSVEPQYPAMPQTIDGQPYEMLGMPNQDADGSTIPGEGDDAAMFGAGSGQDEQEAGNEAAEEGEGGPPIGVKSSLAGQACSECGQTDPDARVLGSEGCWTCGATLPYVGRPSRRHPGHFEVQMPDDQEGAFFTIPSWASHDNDPAKRAETTNFLRPHPLKSGHYQAGSYGPNRLGDHNRLYTGEGKTQQAAIDDVFSNMAREMGHGWWKRERQSKAGSRYFITSGGDVLGSDAYVRHLAIAHSDDRPATIAAVRASREA